MEEYIQFPYMCWDIVAEEADYLFRAFSFVEFVFIKKNPQSECYCCYARKDSGKIDNLFSPKLGEKPKLEKIVEKRKEFKKIISLNIHEDNLPERFKISFTGDYFSLQIFNNYL